MYNIIYYNYNIYIYFGFVMYILKQWDQRRNRSSGSWPDVLLPAIRNLWLISTSCRGFLLPSSGGMLLQSSVLYTEGSFEVEEAFL